MYDNFLFCYFDMKGEICIKIAWVSREDQIQFTLQKKTSKFQKKTSKSEFYYRNIHK